MRTWSRRFLAHNGPCLALGDTPKGKKSKIDKFSGIPNMHHGDSIIALRGGRSIGGLLPEPRGQHIFVIIGYRSKSNFATEGGQSSHSALARAFALHMAERSVCHFSQWFPGKENDATDILFRYHKLLTPTLLLT